MIVAMKKAFVVARSADRDRLLEALRGLGVLHLEPVEAGKAVADEALTGAIDRLGRAIQILESVEPAGEPPAVEPVQAADEVLRIQRESAERRNRLATLHRQLEQLALWGDVRLEQFEALAKAGVAVRFYALPQTQVGTLRAACVQVVGQWPGKRVVAAVVRPQEQAALPPGAEEVPLPARDRPSIRAEAAAIDAAIRADAQRLRALGRMAGPMRRALADLREQAAWSVATRSALADDHLYALRGWVPADQTATLGADIVAAGVDAAVAFADPLPDEQPPTLIRYPFWARPMKGLFDILGTVPGYREFDVSAAFMIALPIFSAILISDAGYGLLYVLLPLVLYRKMARGGAAPLAHLIMVVGVLSVVWGVLTASFFGFNIAGLMGREQPLIAVDMDKAHLDFLMWLSITLGAVQLSAAHVWKAVRNFPGLAALSNLGWATFLWGMYGVLCVLLLGSPMLTVYYYLLVIGGSLAIVFAEPSRNPAKMLALGLANFPLAAIGTFGDTVSYVRLMAIGLGGSALAVTFNEMAATLPIYGTIPVLILGHALNVALSIVALLAHGVRLNMLEFSNNLGMQWSGASYEPFSTKRSQEN